MAIKNFDLVKSIFKGLSADQEQELYAEVLFMVLSGAAGADLNIEAIEAERVCKILKEQLNKDFEPSDIIVAGKTRLYESAPIEKYVRSASGKMTLEHRQAIVYSMIEVFNSDGRSGALEADYFDRIVNALDLKPSELLKI